jgi:hypothetical protein
MYAALSLDRKGSLLSFTCAAAETVGKDGHAGGVDISPDRSLKGLWMTPMGQNGRCALAARMGDKCYWYFKNPFIKIR